MIKNHSLASMPENEIFLERLRIDSLLEQAVKNPVVIVSAGAGYGKTRAVYSFAQKHGIHTTWVQLSGYDNAGEHFWENFTESVAKLDPSVAARLAETGFPSTERLFARCLDIARDSALLSEKYLFVFDDIHLITEDAVLEFIERLAAAPFPHITSLLITRGELRFFSDRIKISAVRITEEDLRFSREETEEYFWLMGIRPNPNTISAVYNDTEGWAFAVYLAALSLRNNPNTGMYVPAALRSNIFKLMESEIAGGLSAELMRFLIKLSLVDTLVPQMLREIAGADCPLIDEMEKTGSFIRYDPYQNAYRIHQLFLDYLRGRQHELSAEEKKEVWTTAALWSVHNNRRIDAIRYFKNAEDYSGLLRAADNFPGILPVQTAGFLLDVLNNASAEFYDAHPEACVIRTRALFVLREFNRAEEELNAVIAKLERGKIGTPEAQILMNCYGNIGFLRSFTCIYTRDYRYVQYFEKALEYSQRCRCKPAPPLAVMYLSSYICRSRESEEMENFTQAFIKMSEYLPQIQNGCGYGGGDLIRAELAFFSGDIAAAETLSIAAVAKARERDQYEIENRGLFFLLRIALYRGDIRGIAGLFGQLEAQLEHRWYLNRFLYHDIISGWFYARIGMPEKIAGWLKSGFEENDFNSTISGMEILLKAGLHIAENRYPAALAVLVESMADKYASGAFLLGRLERLVMEAVCRYRLNDRPGAFCDLENAWELAHTRGLWMPFWELGKDMRALAESALKDSSIKIPRDDLEKIRCSAALYAKNAFAVMRFYRTVTPGAEEKNTGAAALSAREQHVLAGLSQGLTREEIARASSISVNTVKSVIRSIYSKLGAVNRADAIRIASERELL